MLVLLTNDDGIAAEGLASLAAAARSALPAARLVTVAPAAEQSQCGHRVTTATAISVRELAPDRFAVYGSPADCVRIALHALHITPTLTLCGINHGGNLGHDLPISGTAAAARESTLLGIPAIALSHFFRRQLPANWSAATSRAAMALAHLTPTPPAQGHFWNVNLPHLAPDAEEPSLAHCEPCADPLPVSFEELPKPQADPSTRHFRYSGSYPDRPAPVGSDVHACFSGQISISLVPAL
jgi:5'-nucleotidase